MPLLKLQTSDGQIVETDSMKVKCFFEGGLEEVSDGTLIPMPKVSSEVLQRILQWADYHKDDPEPMEVEETENQRFEDMCEWDQQFLNVNQNLLKDILLAAKSLFIYGLEDTISNAIASRFVRESAKETQQTLNMDNNYTQDEEDNVSR